jgi:FkbM family methyltransferase
MRSRYKFFKGYLPNFKALITNIWNSKPTLPHLSYSENAEDLILYHYFQSKGVKTGIYIDIGANHPINFSNTWLFYQKGWRGVTVEPLGKLWLKHQELRPNDISIQSLISDSDGSEMEFFEMEPHEVSTTEKSVVDYLLALSLGYKLKETLMLKTQSLNSVCEQLNGEQMHFMSIDIEGLEGKVFSTFNFSKYKPMVICVESLSENGNESMNKVLDLLDLNGYVEFAATGKNRMFEYVKA